MKPDKARQAILDAAKHSYPDAISAKSIGNAGFREIAEDLARSKLLVKGKFKGQMGYRWPEPTPAAKVMSSRPRATGAAYEREVADAMKKLRESGGMNAKRPATRK